MTALRSDRWLLAYSRAIAVRMLCTDARHWRTLTYAGSRWSSL